MRTGEKVIWFMIGAAIGAGVALLYAPQSGKDTRKLIRRKAEDAKETLVETSEQIRDRIAETSESALKAGRTAYRKSVDLATGAAESAAELLSRAKAQVRG